LPFPLHPLLFVPSRSQPLPAAAAAEAVAFTAEVLEAFTVAAALLFVEGLAGFVEVSTDLAEATVASAVPAFTAGAAAIGVTHAGVGD